MHLDKSEDVDKERQTSRPGSILEVLGVFTRLGLTSFGGPVAHLGYFDEFDVLVVIGAIERGLHDLGAKIPLGAGLTAAQKALVS